MVLSPGGEELAVAGVLPHGDGDERQLEGLDLLEAALLALRERLRYDVVARRALHLTHVAVTTRMNMKVNRQ